MGLHGLLQGYLYVLPYRSSRGGILHLRAIFWATFRCLNTWRAIQKTLTHLLDSKHQFPCHDVLPLKIKYPLKYKVKVYEFALSTSAWREIAHREIILHNFSVGIILGCILRKQQGMGLLDQNREE
jgi:hypothetical protein